MSTTQYLLTNRVSGREKLYRAGSGRAAARGMHALPGPCSCAPFTALYVVRSYSCTPHADTAHGYTYTYTLEVSTRTDYSSASGTSAS